MSVAHLRFPAYAKAKLRSPERPAIRELESRVEDAIASEDDIRAGLSLHLKRLWRYAIVLSRQRDVADDHEHAPRVAEEQEDHQTGQARADRALGGHALDRVDHRGRDRKSVV